MKRMEKKTQHAKCIRLFAASWTDPSNVQCVRRLDDDEGRPFADTVPQVSQDHRRRTTHTFYNNIILSYMVVNRNNTVWRAGYVIGLVTLSRVYRAIYRSFFFFFVPNRCERSSRTNVFRANLNFDMETAWLAVALIRNLSTFRRKQIVSLEPFTEALVGLRTETRPGRTTRVKYVSKPDRITRDLKRRLFLTFRCPGVLIP